MMTSVASIPSVSLPSSLGKVVAEYWIEAATAIAYTVQTGQYIQIVDVEGCQCSDLVAFSGSDYQEELDATVTRTLNGLSMPVAGLHGKYFSQHMQPLLEVIQDTCNRHDSFLLACTARYYEDLGYPGHPSCSDNFNQALQPYGIAPRPGWSAINFFYNTAVDEAGAIVGGESWSRPGDYVLLRAHRDLLCASSSCADDIDPVNGWTPTPILVRVYDAAEEFPRAIGRRASATAPVRLTRPSAFTPRIQQLTSNLIEYNGFWVPNSFTNHGVQDEYWALRERAVLLDLSALRKFDVSGTDALQLLQLAFSRDVSKLAIGQAAYGCLLNPHGGIIDDGIVFCLPPSTQTPNSNSRTDAIHHVSTQHPTLNAQPSIYRYVGNCDTDADWLSQVAAQYDLMVKIQPCSDRLHNLAIQGPLSRQILRSLTQFGPEFSAFTIDDLPYFHFATGTVANIPVLISRTGYTGELGYELFVHPDRGAELWDALMAAGKPVGLQPMGMLALDRARIEAGLLAAGREFDDLTSPYQAGIGWTVAMKKSDFIGKAALEAIRQHPPKVTVGLVLEGQEVAAGGQCVHPIGENWRVGTITSATFSPILNRSIALAQITPEYATPGTVLEVGLVDGLKRRVQATVGTLAAYDPTKSRVRA
jgi:aminomethyltransferase